MMRMIYFVLYLKSLFYFNNKLIYQQVLFREKQAPYQAYGVEYERHGTNYYN